MSGAGPASAGGPAMDWFATGRVRADLPRLAARGGVAMVGAQALVLLLTVGSTAVLARVLEPRDFGLLAMSLTLLNLARLVKDTGITNAVVHNPGLDHRLASTAFWRNVTLSLLLVGLLAALAPGLAWFYGEPDLVAITLVLTCGVLLGALGAVHLALMRRQLRFPTLARISLVASVCGIATALALALAGAGYWALVGQVLMSNVVSAAGWLVACRWRPAARRDRLPADAEGVREMRAYGRHASMSKLAGYAGRNADFIIVGRFAGAGALGLYEKAFTWSALPFRQLYAPLLDVVVSGLSRLQDDTARYRAFFRSAARGVFTIVLPVLALLMVESRDLVLLLLGDQWLDAVPLFRILLVAAFLSSVTQMTTWVYLSEGRPRRDLQWGLISLPVLVAAVGIGVAWGATGVAVGYTAAAVALTYPSLRWCLAGSRLRPPDIFGALAHATLAAAGAAVIVLALQPVLERAPLGVDLVASAAAMTVLYLLALAATPGGRAGLAETTRLARAVRRPAPAHDVP